MKPGRGSNLSRSEPAPSPRGHQPPPGLWEGGLNCQAWGLFTALRCHPEAGSGARPALSLGLSFLASSLGLVIKPTSKGSCRTNCI